MTYVTEKFELEQKIVIYYVVIISVLAIIMNALVFIVIWKTSNGNRSGQTIFDLNIVLADGSISCIFFPFLVWMSTYSSLPFVIFPSACATYRFLLQLFEAVTIFAIILNSLFYYNV